jgi:phage tail tape-measure protein
MRSKAEIHGGRMNLSQAWEQNKRFNKLIGKSHDKDIRQMWGRVGKDIRETVLEPSAKKIKPFGELYGKANELHKALEVPSTVRKYLEGKDTNPFLKKLFGYGGTAALLYNPLGTLKKAAVGVPMYYGVRGTARFADAMHKSPTARKLFGELSQSILEDNKAAILRSVRGLNEEANKLTETPKKFRLVD